MIADEKDQVIREILKPLLPIAERQFRRFDADVAQVYRQLVIEASNESFCEYQNDIWWVRRGQAEHITNFVRDFDPAVKIEDVKAFLIRPGRFDRQAALEAEIIHLEKDRIYIQKGDGKNRAANLVIGFDTAQPGDLLGVSIKLMVKETLNWRSWLVAESEPVARVELRVRNGAELAYNEAGHRFAEGMIKTEILEQVGGQIRDIRLWADAVDPILYEPYAPPDFKQSPGFQVSWRARLLFLGGGQGIWWYYRHWNQVAIRMSAAENQYLKKTKHTDEEAGRVAAQLAGMEAADALFRFVRDELIHLPSRAFYRNDDWPTVDEILKTGAGSSTEKSYLLLAMLRSRGLMADIIWTHDTHSGGFFTDYPNWGQVPNPLVRVTSAGKTRWFDIGCHDCRPGKIRPRFIAEPGLSYQGDTEYLHDEFIDAVMNEALSRHVNPADLYLRSIVRKNWCSLIDIPGDLQRPAGWTRETLRFEEVSDQSSVARLRILSGGLTPLRRNMLLADTPEAVVLEWAQARYEIARDTTEVALSSSGADTLDVSVRLDCGPIGAPMDDVWILPPAVVFGEPAIGPWPTKRRTPFRVEQSLDRHWEFRIPLPEGWERVEVPEDRTLGFKLMKYEVSFRVYQGELVVRRSLEERVGSVDKPESVALIGKEAAAIRELETTPVVLRRIGD